MIPPDEFPWQQQEAVPLVPKSSWSSLELEVSTHATFAKVASCRNSLEGSATVVHGQDSSR